MQGSLTGQEVIVFLRFVLSGQVILQLENSALSWDKTYCGVIGFKANGWTLRFFNDCDSLDYCDSATDPDGRAGTFEGWQAAGEEPVALLCEAEQRALEDLLHICS